MASPVSVEADGEIGGPGRSSDEIDDGLDVGWLLHSKKDQPRRGPSAAVTQKEMDKPPTTRSNPEPTPPHSPIPVPEAPLVAKAASQGKSKDKPTVMDQKEANAQPETVKSHVNPVSKASPAAPGLDRPGQLGPAPSPGPKYHLKRPSLLGRSSHQDDNKSTAQTSPPSTASSKQTSRRQSWITTLSSKFSSPGAASPNHSSSFDAVTPDQIGPLSPSVASSKPAPHVQSDAQDKGQPKKEQKGEEKPALGLPRRPSVLVQAGRERDDHTSFLQSALRKLSSGSSTFGKGPGSCPAAQRKTMNLDRNRQRVKIAELEASKLRRVAFCVDVEVVGYASWHEVEEFEAERRAARIVDVGAARRQSPSILGRQMQNVKGKKDKKDVNKDLKEVKAKDEAEGAALKDPQAAQAQKEENPVPTSDETIATATPVETKASETMSESAHAPRQPSEPSPSDPQPIPGARKKEKKKRSEAERKERKERRRKRAEADGEVPLELTACNDDDGESTISPSPLSGSSLTPSPPTAPSPPLTLSPTTDPLRIYKRCAQLRETTAVEHVCRQISSPSSTLAESPGTIAVLDLSGTVMSLPDLVTLSDWLAIVPVRKLLLEDFQLTDEGARVVLSGLLGCKTAEQARHNRRLPKGDSHSRGEEWLGVIEKISLKGNSKITNVGWKHIALFLHTSKSLRAIDLSGIPFPSESGTGERLRSRRATTTPSKTNSHSKVIGEGQSSIGVLLSKALAERFGGNTLEELIMSNCNLSTASVVAIVEAATRCKLRRLSLAGNNISEEGIDSIIPYVESGVCEGLDLSGNDLQNCMKPLSDSLVSNNDFLALSLSGCNLSPSNLQSLLPSFVRLSNFRFVDLSGNQELFSSQPNAVSLLRKYLPQMAALKRIHLNDVGLSPEHVIALAEILPECRALAHLSILDNPSITNLMNSKDAAAQEEACALFASLMTAVRVSHSIVAIDIEVPSSDSNQIVKALASQVIAHTLRNMEHGALKEIEGAIPTAANVPSEPVREILAHLCGNVEGEQGHRDPDEPVPDENYLMGGNAIVKALGVCLGTAEDNSRATSRDVSPRGSGVSTPKVGAVGRKPDPHKKPRDMSKQLLESARQIKMRLMPALVREDSAGNDLNYRRLQFLNATLQRMIQRYEDEYPECKEPTSTPQPKVFGPESCPSSYVEPSVMSDSGSDVVENADADNEPLAVRLSQSPSSTSLALKALAEEEGRMHRYGQSIRREIALGQNDKDSGKHLSADSQPQTPTNAISAPSSASISSSSFSSPPPPSAANVDKINSTATDQTSSQADESSRLDAIEHRLRNISGDQLAGFGERCHRDGVDKALFDVLGVNAQELSEVARSDPETFEKFRLSQVAAVINTGA